MPSMGLEFLPQVPLDRICEYLADAEIKRDSLFAFSLVSKNCCAAANRQRFERINLHIDGRTKLEADLAKWSLVLDQDGRKQVHKLKVYGGMPIEREIKCGTNEVYRRNFRHHPKSGLDYVREIEDERFNRSENSWFLDLPDILTPFLDSAMDETDKHANNAMWIPLARFLTELPGLKDLVWNSTDQVPKCILETIHSSRTRLRLQTLDFRSITSKTKYPCSDSLDLNEYDIATSSNLTQIFVNWGRGRPSGSGAPYEFNLEMVLRMVAQSAPNLTHVCIQLWSPTRTRDNTKLCCPAYPCPDFLGEIDPKWSVNTSDDGDSLTKGNLKILEIRGQNPLCTDCLSEWHRHTHFQKLLRLEICLDPESLLFMVQIAQAGFFRLLQDLSLEIHSPDEESVNKSLCSLLAALRPLTSLSLNPISHPDVWRATLQFHGRTLKKLFTRSRLSNKQILNMPRFCTSLEQFQFDLQRSGGDRHEVNVYRALGAMPRLERLTLHLVGWLHYPDPPREDDDSVTELCTDEEKFHSMRLAVINSAVDDDLARAIYTVISDTQATVNHSPRRPFSHLNLYYRSKAYIRGQMTKDSFLPIAQVLQRNWVCKRDMRDTHADEVYISEIRGAFRNYNGDVLNRPLANLKDGHLYERVWKDLWPEATGHWVDNWHSLPLASLDDPEPAVAA